MSIRPQDLMARDLGHFLLGAMAALILSLAIVTIVPAAIALARAFADWVHRGDSAVFRNTFRHFRQVWVRTLWIGIVAECLIVVLVPVTVLAYLSWELEDNALWAVVMFLSVLCYPALLLILLSSAAASAAHPHARSWDWIGAGAKAIVGFPGRSALVLLVTVVVAFVCAVFPPLVPVLIIAVPVYAAVRAWPSDRLGMSVMPGGQGRQ